MSESAACRDSRAHEVVEDWQQAHQELSRLARSRAGLDFEEGRWLLAAWRGGVHERLGYGSYREYVERLFGYSARLVQDKLRVAEALEGLPLLSQALQDGQACWSVLRELTRVATPATETEWLTAAEGRTARDVERLVSGHAPGSRPSDERDVALDRHVLRFEVTGEVLATFGEPLAKLRRESGEALDDDAALLLLARAVLQGPSDEGRASYQVLLTVCEQCQHAAQQGDGEQVRVGPELVGMAECDGQHLGRLDDLADAAAGSEHAHVGNGHAHTGPGHCDDGATTQRAVQTVPPAIRRVVLRRDSGRCMVPCCRHATWVDVHHLNPRAEGGGHDPSNLITLCGAHHRALHRGQLVIEGRASSHLTFRHADGTRYGGVVSPAVADANTKAFQALCRMGFRQSDVRRAPPSWALARTSKL
jgi:hypothetical protein